MTHTYLLAHDLGTTGNKATLFEAEEGRVRDTTFEPYATVYTQPGWAEQDPADWQKAIWQCTRRLLSQTGIKPGAIAGVSFSGHMQGALLVDRQGTPLSRAIIWADQRATPQAEFKGSVCDAQTLYHLTRQRLSPTDPALLDLFRQTYEALDPIFARLAGFAAGTPGLENH